MSRSAVEVLLDADCSSVEKLVLLAIARHGRGTDGSGGYPSVRRIAKMAGVSRSTVKRTVDSLRAKKWLSWSSGNARENKANTYTLHLDAIPMLPNLWRSPVPTIGTALYSPQVQPYAHHRPSPISTIGIGLYPSEAKPVPTMGTQASTEARDKDDDTRARDELSSSSSCLSFSLKSAQEFWNAHRGEMEKSEELSPHDQRMFVARVREGLTQDLFRAVVLQMAATPHFCGETTGYLGKFAWLLKTHKETGKGNFRHVLKGDYEPRSSKKLSTVTVTKEAPSYKRFAANGEDRKPQ
ncbi:helix-turn-helix domain-containing protein [Acidobacterium sp. S8]|uniref:helix-turn-helix domain-containing protein n=1 Tax=Acidobacterium sp. S8 TaxID=1641854 RepID=UPI00131CCAEF|nr:helix-turn-helix domain-containing protein [Acidobacterium sp. S8]